MEKRTDDLLKWKFESVLDRKLILGLLEKHVELEYEEDKDMMVGINENPTSGRHAKESSVSSVSDLSQDKDEYEEATNNLKVSQDRFE